MMLEMDERRRQPVAKIMRFLLGPSWVKWTRKIIQQVAMKIEVSVSIHFQTHSSTMLCYIYTHIYISLYKHKYEYIYIDKYDTFSDIRTVILVYSIKYPF